MSGPLLRQRRLDVLFSSFTYVAWSKLAHLLMITDGLSVIHPVILDGIVVMHANKNTLLCGNKKAADHETMRQTYSFRILCVDASNECTRCGHIPVFGQSVRVGDAI